MKKLGFLLIFALLFSVLNAWKIRDGILIFSPYGANKDSLNYIAVAKAGGVLDTVMEICSTGVITWYYNFDITADSASKIDTTYGPFQTYVAAHGGGGSVFDTVTIEGSDDTLDIYFSNDTLFFDSRIGSAYFDLSEFIVLFGSGTMNLDDIQPATNDSSSSQIGTNTNPYGRGDFVDMKAIGYIDFQSTDSLSIPLWNNCPANAPIGAIGLDTTGTDTLWLKTQDGWGVITFGIP